MTTLARRILAEKRRLIVSLGIAIVANVLLYTLVVYPLAVQSSSRRRRPRCRRCSQRLAAERELQVARGLITGKAEAEKKSWSAFYKKVLPANVSAARSLTYVPVIEIARRNDVNYVNRVYEDPEELHNEDSGRLGVSLKRLTTSGRAPGRLRKHPGVHLRARTGAAVRRDRSGHPDGGRGGRARDADRHAVDLLSGGECSLTAAGSRTGGARCHSGWRSLSRLAAIGCAGSSDV